MDVAASLRQEGAPHGTLVVADHQRAGRGRSGRTWVSARGQNLLFSLIVDASGARDRGLLPLCVGEAVAGAIEGMADRLAPQRDPTVTVQVKWPNDVLMAGCKVAGVLCDSNDGWINVGVGVTCNQRKGLPAGPFPARSLRQLLRCRVDRWELLGLVLQRLHDRLGDAGEVATASVSSIEERLFGKGMEMSVDQAPRGLPSRGVFTGLAEDGAALLRDDAGRTHRYYSGRLVPSTAYASASPRA